MGWKFVTWIVFLSALTIISFIVGFSLIDTRFEFFQAWSIEIGGASLFALLISIFLKKKTV